ncbi:MAG: type II toxin-antitoxin system HicA family toxin [Candidatus Micrarchaeota archaeon]|nr:type II toxin-antitoxin system HicA family toxin [Candidatus Micrarchaeota archaeon]
MSRLVPLNYDKVVKALSRIGYVVNHQRGSHIVMHLDKKGRYFSLFPDRRPEYMVVVPAHRPIGKGMVRTIMSEVGLSVEEFNRLL